MAGADTNYRHRFHDRSDAGRILAAALQTDQAQAGVVLGIPRGGIVVAFEVAQILHVPLGVVVVHKVGFPGQQELAIGAVAAGEVQVVSHELDPCIQHLGVRAVDAAFRQETARLARSEACYRDIGSPICTGRAVILVDDGLATGSTLRAAIIAVRRQNPSTIVVAVPVGAHSSCTEIAASVDGLVCVMQPTLLGAVGDWYEDFEEVHDEEACRLLENGRTAY